MLKIVGIIAEYDPFHAGHAWQIMQARKAGAEAVVCVMSPSVVQRGGFSLFPADVRARAALAGGGDLLISLPAPYAACSAEGFASAGVHLLNALGCVDTLCFGAETPDASVLQQTSRTLCSREFQAEITHFLKNGASFASARAQAAEAVQPGAKTILSTPNNILGIEYCKAIQTQNSSMKIFPVPRQGVEHNASAPGEGFASASTLRNLFRKGGAGELSPYVPADCMPFYHEAESQGLVLNPDAVSLAILSRLRALSPEQLSQTRGIREGLEHRLFHFIQTSSNLSQLYDNLKTKRYAHARLRRLVLDAALGWTAQSLSFPPPYLHILGATTAGFAVLKKAKQTASLPLSASLAELRALSEQTKLVADAHSAAEDLASLCLYHPRPCGIAYTQSFSSK